MKRLLTILALVALAVVGGAVAGLGVGGLFYHGSQTSRAMAVKPPRGPPAVASSARRAARARPCASDSMIATVRTRSVAARRAPAARARAIARFHRINPEGSPQTFLVRGEVRHHGRTWYRALLPLRPNGTMGYIAAGSVTLSQTPYRLLVVQHRFRLTLWRNCSVVRTFPVGIGAGETPTPIGRFYLASLVRPPTPDSVYGAYAYGLSAYSKVIRTWKWGGVIGLHGTNDPSSVGHNVSHGCIRMRNRAILFLVHILPLGTPISIER